MVFPRHTGDGRGPVRSAATAVWVLLALVLMSCGSAGVGGQDDAVALPPRGVVSQPPAVSVPEPPPQAMAEADGQVADPVRVRMPVIGVDAPVESLDLDANNVLPPPPTNEGTGWWRGGPEPGERGPAVIVGHVDSHQGPAVFFRLHELRAGQQIHVDRADSSTATFVVTRVERHDKLAFPTQAVYGDTPEAELRLITCGGDFDRENRRYLDNIIVYAQRSS